MQKFFKPIFTGKPPLGMFIDSFSAGYKLGQNRKTLLQNIQTIEKVNAAQKKEGIDKNGNGFWCLFSCYEIVKNKEQLIDTLEKLPYCTNDIKEQVEQSRELGPSTIKQMKLYLTQLEETKAAVQKAEAAIKEMASSTSFGSKNR